MAPSPKPLFGFRNFFRERKRPRAIKPRSLRPENHTQPSLASLDYEILVLVVHHLHNLDPQSINRLSLVCSDLYSKARYVQHSQTCIDISNGNAADRLQRIVRTNHLPAIRSLYVTGGPIEAWDEIRSPGPRGLERRKRELETWARLADLVPLMAGLCNLHWTGAAIPDSVLDHLGKHPRIRLHLSLAVNIRRDAQYARLKQLPARVRNLSSALIKLRYPSADICRPVTHALKNLLVSSPQLSKLSLDIDYPRGGCVSFGPETLYCGLGLRKGERLSPLHELVVMAYPMGRLPTGPGLVINSLDYPGPVGTEMEYWAENMDWSQLRRLALYGGPYAASLNLAEHLAPHLSSALEEAKFVFPGGNTASFTSAIANFFAKLRGSVQLSSLDMPSVRDLSLSSISAHASNTLRTLSVYREPLDVQELSLLRDALPHLECLTVVCARHVDDVEPARWPYDTTLATLGTFLRLRHLTLCFATGPPSDPHRPYLTFSSARDIFVHLQRQQQHERQDGLATTRLQQVHLHSGLLRQGRDEIENEFSDEVYWPRDNETSFICERQRDRTGGYDGDICVTCPKLGKLQIEKLGRWETEACVGNRGRDTDIEGNIDVLVAWKGPMTMSEWLRWRRERGIYFNN